MIIVLIQSKESTKTFNDMSPCNVNKDLSLKAKAKAKDSSHKAKAKDSSRKAKAKDLKTDQGQGQGLALCP